MRTNHVTYFERFLTLVFGLSDLLFFFITHLNKKEKEAKSLVKYIKVMLIQNIFFIVYLESVLTISTRSPLT